MNAATTHPTLHAPAEPNPLLSFSLAVFDATSVSYASDLTRSSAVSLPAVRNLLSLLLAPAHQYAAVDPRDSRASARKNPVIAVAKLAARQMFLAAAKKFAAAESLRREGVARMARWPMARWPMARCRLGAASLPRIARKKLVATGGFEPASSKTSRRRYQLDYET